MVAGTTGVGLETSVGIAKGDDGFDSPQVVLANFRMIGNFFGGSAAQNFTFVDNVGSACDLQDFSGGVIGDQNPDS